MPIDKRLTDLEIKATLTEDLLDQLNKTVFMQQQQIDFLAQELKILRQQIPHERPSQTQNLIDEIPPHY